MKPPLHSRFLLAVAASPGQLKVWLTGFLLFFNQLAAVARTDVFKIGSATKLINPELGSFVQAATTVKRATAIKGDLEANGIYLSKGEFQLLMVSCDLGGLESPFVAKAREAMAAASGIPPRDIIISCTHSRGPSLLKTNYLMPLDTAYMERLEAWLVDLAKEAVSSARPGRIGWAKDEVRLGRNRRLTWADGTHSMGGDPQRSDFNGLEGPDDPQHTVIFAEDMEGTLLAIAWNNTTHVPMYYGAGIFSSALPGRVRESIRDKTRNDLPVLFLNGAQGDVTLRNETANRLTEMVVGKTMELHDRAAFHDDPVLKHKYHDLKVAIRFPSPEALKAGKEILARIDAGENIRGMEMIMAFGAVYLQEEYEKDPFDIIQIHAIRIGDLAIVTQSCELFCQFGLDIKRRSPFSTTAVVGIADGFGGYCPTIYGILGGGYTGTPIAWTRFEPCAGYKIVETASRLLYDLSRAD